MYFFYFGLSLIWDIIFCILDLIFWIFLFWNPYGPIWAHWAKGSRPRAHWDQPMAHWDKAQGQGPLGQGPGPGPLGPGTSPWPIGTKPLGPLGQGPRARAHWDKAQSPGPRASWAPIWAQNGSRFYFTSVNPCISMHGAK